jgi:sporadic carbohydrate cluster protein (TIGR04323 family)
MNNIPNRSGFRGYVAARPFFGERAPQHIQNIVIRDHAKRFGLEYKLSAVEYAMPHCYMMLDDVLGEIDRLQGIIVYSLFMLPEKSERRLAIYRRILGAGTQMHFAVEGMVLASEADIQPIEDIWALKQAVAEQPAPDAGLLLRHPDTAA